jgi:hypothetical protein
MTPYAVDGFRKCRVGSDGDGGYVMLDDFGSIATAVSVGIGDNDSWDIALAARGIRVLQFDHSVAGAPNAHPLCTFHRKKIVARPSESADETTLDAAAGALTGEAILKMDIEGDEYDVLAATSRQTLLKFRQIICEFHGLALIGQRRRRRTVFNVFRRLAPTHAIIHVHANNGGGAATIGGIAVPDVVEFSFVRRSDYRLRESGETFPTDLDRRNNPHAPELTVSQLLAAGAQACPPPKSRQRVI